MLFLLQFLHMGYFKICVYTDLGLVAILTQVKRNRRLVLKDIEHNISMVTKNSKRAVIRVQNVICLN